MARTISIGAQGFADMRERGYYLVDKTGFIRDWWQAGDVATLICKPRRFGKTLNMSMVECFLSLRYAGRPDLFEGLEVWGDQAMRAEQGVWPVVFLSFADIKAPTYQEMREKVVSLLADAFQANLPLLGDPTAGVAALADRLATGTASDADVSLTPKRLCEALRSSTGRRAVVLLDEYDTPLQEAWLSGYWAQASALMRGLLNSTFKTNPYLERGLITGVTRVAHESIFSDLNNLKVVSFASSAYARDFGFTQGEVDAALMEFGLSDSRDDVRRWYDGFTFGDVRDIYNPWSITNYLDERRLDAYWANTSGNSLVARLVGQSDAEFKADFETLLNGEPITERVSAQITFPDLEQDPSAVWSLLAASGYLRISTIGAPGEGICELQVTNHETMLTLDTMVRRWFATVRTSYNAFVRALLSGDLRAMNVYLNDVALDTFSTFDTGKRPSGSEPERFYHGFVLGLLVELRGRFLVRSNRESGFGRYDVMLVPLDTTRDPGIVMEFKVLDSWSGETGLEDTVASALEQIAERGYAAELCAHGVPRERIHAYGFAFEGKHVLVGA